MAKKEDLRIIKTRRDLRLGLINLLQEKKFEKITVTDICKRSLVNRITFYKHYEDKHQLLNDTILYFNKFFQDLLPPKDKIKSVTTATLYLKSVLVIVLDECTTHKDIIDLLTSQKNEIINQLINDLIEEFISDILVQISKITPLKYPIKLITVFLTQGISQTIYYWLNHQDEYPRTEIMNAIDDIVSRIGQTMTE